MMAKAKARQEPEFDEVPEPIPPFRPPAIEIGDMVFWYPHGQHSETPWIGIVVHIGMDNIDVNLMSRGRDNFLRKVGCRHINDPEVELRPALKDFGCWDATPRLKRAIALEAITRD